MDARLKSELQTITNSILAIQNLHKEASSKISQTDLLLSDLYHEIEFEKLTAPQMMVKFKELKQCLKVRRQHKVEFEALQSVVASLDSNKLHSIVKVSNKTEKKYRTKIESSVRKEILNCAKEL